jgi:hypothetical protein
MPIYEFMSRDTGKIYSFFAHSPSYAEKTPNCPDGKKYKMEKVMSGFSITGKNEEPPEVSGVGGVDDPDDPFAGMDPNQVEKVMKELEGAMGGMDEDNPDPKQMGQLMRKMCEMTGESMDEPMEEVVRKLEEGADPDELEDRMGDFMGDEEPGGASNSEQDDPKESVKSRLKRMMRKKMVRDPELYEFSEYIKN